MNPLNLKTKSSLAIAALLVAVFGAGAAIQDPHLVRTALKQTIVDQQFALVSRVADEIDNRLRVQFDALRRVAAGIDAAMLADPARLQDYIADKPGILAVFDDMVVCSAELRVLADFPVLPNRRGTDVSSFVHLRDVVENGRETVSEPFIGKVGGRPTLTQSVPVFDHDGHLVAVLSGQMSLLDPGFLGALSRRRIGKDGHFVLTTRDRTTLVSRFPERLLQPNAAPGANPLYDRALAGWEGSGDGRTSYGVVHPDELPLPAHHRLGDRRDPAAGGSLRTDPCVRRVALVLTFGASLLVGLLVWLMMRGLLRPLLRLRENVRRLRDDPALVASIAGRQRRDRRGGDRFLPPRQATWRRPGRKARRAPRNCGPSSTPAR